MRPISSGIVDDLIENGRIFLFQLYNKDFSSMSKVIKDGDPQSANLHTIYWKALFSDSNLNKTVIKLNGEAELFYRKRSNMDVFVHKKGEIILNRTDTDGNPVPERIFSELFRYYTHPGSHISEDAKPYLQKVRMRNAPHDIQKDRRYTVDKMFLHVPITFNFACDSLKGNNMNSLILEDAIRSGENYFIGIDRGERNLIYICLINSKGEIICQKSMNLVGGFDYRSRLDDREKIRKEDRRNWNAIHNISNLKEGYVSAAVHEIVDLAVRYNALIVMEELNFGFKRGRYKIEKQVYQKFESMLLNKLNHLVLKRKSPDEPGGVLNAYQLSPRFESFAKMGKQSGIVLYVPAAYTSQIDPVTGFADVFNKGSGSKRNAQDFLERMDKITYDPVRNCFCFSFDYDNYQTWQEMHKKKWTVCTVGERIKYSKKDNKYITYDPTEIIKNALRLKDIPSEGDLKQAIVSDSYLVEQVFFALSLTLKMRNSDESRDYIISPVAENGRFYFSEDYHGENSELPIDADANGAYNIARKGMMWIDKCSAAKEGKKAELPKITNKDWFEFIQGGK